MADENEILAQRIDKWLFHSRFIKSRALATKLVNANRIRVNGEKIAKASYKLKIADILTFELNDRIMMIEILGINATRRPFKEACLLYDDQSPAPEPRTNKDTPDFLAPPFLREKGAGRPTKKQRRETDQFRLNALDF
ncbi:MAG: RNA-binding protein [Hyphomicrobiales bacterium]|nr:MAG: RNA-binding protein [Hyphomicrobiales bacterium]